MKTLFNNANSSQERRGGAIYYFLFFCSVLLYVFWMYQSIRYTLSILDAQYFLEPAENEHLVYAYFLRHNSIANLSLMIDQGLLPIYPDFFHHLANLINENVLKSLRLVSNFSFYASMFVIMFWAYKVTRSLILALLLPLLLFGSGIDITYFMMARTDSVYVFFGLLSVALLSNFRNNVGVVFSAIFIALSVLTKQSALYFLFLDSLLLIYLYFQKEITKIQVTIFVSTFVSLLICYYLFINSEIFNMYTTGIRLYGKSVSFTSIIHHLYRVVMVYSFYLVLILSLSYYLLTKKKKGTLDIFWLLALVLTATVSLKLFSNIAAFPNNFIFISFISVVLIIYFNAIISQKIGVNMMLALILLTAVRALFVVDGSGLNFVFSKAYERSLGNGMIDDSKIFQYIKNNRGNVLTDRLDYYNYFSGNNLGYEGSVLTSALRDYKSGAYSKEEILYDSFVALDYRLNDNFKNKKYSAIILGIQNELLIMYPQILKTYKVLYVEKITNGQFNINVRMYIPKDNDINDRD